MKFTCKKGDYMSSKSGFISNLNKSTKITMASCIGFVLLTGIILVIFILFPITPSEKVMASIGRENISNKGSDGSPQSVTPVVVTTSADDADEEIVTTTTRAGTTTTRTVNIRITTGSGFLWNGRIPTGVMGGGSSTTVVEDPEIPTPDPGVTGTGIPQGTTPPENPGSGTDTPQATTPNPDPNGGTVTPPADEPVTPPDTPVTPPVENPDPPPAETPEPPPAEGEGTAEGTW